MMGKPKAGKWAMKRAEYSPAVHLMAEAESDHPELYQRLAYLGHGASGPVA